MRVADRGYFFVVGAACALGWQYRIWPLPLLAFAVLEGASVYAARRAPRLPAPVRLHVVLSQLAVCLWPLSLFGVGLHLT
jgi:hypothetical protein